MTITTTARRALWLALLAILGAVLAWNAYLQGYEDGSRVITDGDARNPSGVRVVAVRWPRATDPVYAP